MDAQKNISISSVPELYNAELEHPREETQKAIRWAEEEQRRRMSDPEGENRKLRIAGQVSEVYSKGIRTTWFQRGSSFVFSLLGSVRQSGKEIVNSQSVKNLNAKMQIAGQKGVAIAQDVSTTVANKAAPVGQKASETAANIKGKSLETAQDIKTKSIAIAQNISTKAQETTKDIRAKSAETAQDAKEKSKVLAARLKSAVTSMKLYKKLNKSFSNLAENTNLAFALLEEENERAYRMNSPTEIFAIMNAMGVARLIKSQSNLYRAEVEPFSGYYTRLLEEAERSRRVQESDTAAVNNAKTMSLLITAKFAPVLAVPAKAEIVPEITLSKPLVATM